MKPNSLRLKKFNAKRIYGFKNEPYSAILNGLDPTITTVTSATTSSRVMR